MKHIKFFDVRINHPSKMQVMPSISMPIEPVTGGPGVLHETSPCLTILFDWRNRTESSNEQWNIITALEGKLPLPSQGGGCTKRQNNIL